MATHTVISMANNLLFNLILHAANRYNELNSCHQMHHLSNFINLINLNLISMTSSVVELEMTFLIFPCSSAAMGSGSYTIVDLNVSSTSEILEYKCILRL